MEAIYATATQPALWPDALQVMADCFDDIGGVLLWQRDDGGFGTIVSPSLAAAQRDYVENGWHMRDIIATRAVERSLFLQSDAVTDRHAVSDEEVATHPFYTEFLARHGLRWRAAVGIAPDPHMQVAITVQRIGKKPAFTDAELATMTRLGRHAEKALRLSVRLLDAELANVRLGEALARVGIGVFALDLLGRVLFANPAGKRLLGRHVDIVEGRLRIGAAADQGATDAAIRRTLRGDTKHLVDDPKPILLHRSEADRPLVIYVLPVASPAEPAEQFLTHTRAIVLVIDSKIDDPADPAVVRDLLGLTLGEARVAALIGSGLPPRDAAEKLGIAEETARSTLKRIFSKVGVSRQSELAALLGKLVLR